MDVPSRGRQRGSKCSTAIEGWIRCSLPSRFGSVVRQFVLRLRQCGGGNHAATAKGDDNFEHEMILETNGMIKTHC